MSAVGLQKVCIRWRVDKKLSTKGKTFMNQKVIDVTLTVLSDKDVLVFRLDDEHPDEFVVNLNSPNSQNELKAVFSQLLQTILEAEVLLRFVIAPGYSKNLYKDVCKEYIDDLNRELSQIKAVISKEIDGYGTHLNG